MAHDSLTDPDSDFFLYVTGSDQKKTGFLFYQMWYYTQMSNAVVCSDQYYSSRYWGYLMRFDPARSL